MSCWRCVVFAFVVLLADAIARPAGAATQRTWDFLTTGNGHGFAVYDTNQKKISTFLEHPYRYLRPRANPMSDGVGRRNLAYDFYFGIQAGASGWLNGAAAAGDPEYLDQTNIIHAAMSLGGTQADTYYFEPFGYEGNAMVALIKAPGATSAYALFNFHMGSTALSDTMPSYIGESVRASSEPGAVVETGPGGGALVYVPLSGIDGVDCQGVYTKGAAGQNLGQSSTCAGDDLVPGMQRKLGGDGWWAVAMQFVEDPTQADAAATALKAWAAARTPDKILADEQAGWAAWRSPPPAQVTLSPDELKVWRQGEAVLRMGQVREANTPMRKNHGMMLASLPPGEWHTGWVRDGTYAIVALARMGHHAEARAALDFLLNAAPVGKFARYVSNQSYRISVVRYFGSGEEEADYSGQPSPNVETDGWGLVMSAARQYVDASGDTSWLSSMTTSGMSVYDVLASGVAAPLEANLESGGIVKADSSIWEVHDDNKRHFAYTSLAATRGFCDMATLAQRAGRTADVAKYQALSTKVRTGLFGAFLDQGQAIAGSLEGLQNNLYTDASVVEAINWGIVPDPAGKIALATLDLLNKLVVSSGGYKRNDTNQSSYDNNEWILIDLRMATALRQAGRGPAADALIAQVVEKASANFYLLPELYNAVPTDGQIGKYTGSIPMVGYGGGAFVMTMLDRAGLYGPTDCASSILTDAGVQQSDLAGTSMSGSDGGGDVPYVLACICQVGGGRRLPLRSALLVALPWIAVAIGLRRRRR